MSNTQQQKYTPWLVMIIIILLVSCTSESEEYDHYQAECYSLEREEQNLQKEFEYLQSIQQRVYNSTAKERFAFIHDFFVGKELKFGFDPNILSVRFENNGENHYNVAINISRYASNQSKFIVYLFNSQGLLLGASKKLSYSKTYDVRGEIVLNEFELEPNTPTYFRIETVYQ